jgi:hypothetical protein
MVSSWAPRYGKNRPNRAPRSSLEIEPCTAARPPRWLGSSGQPIESSRRACSLARYPYRVQAVFFNCVSDSLFIGRLADGCTCLTPLNQPSLNRKPPVFANVPFQFEPERGPIVRRSTSASLAPVSRGFLILPSYGRSPDVTPRRSRLSNCRAPKPRQFPPNSAKLRHRTMPHSSHSSFDALRSSIGSESRSNPRISLILCCMILTFATSSLKRCKAGPSMLGPIFRNASVARLVASRRAVRSCSRSPSCSAKMTGREAT